MKRRRVDGTRPKRRHDPRGAAWLAVLIMTVAAGLPRPAAAQSEGSWDNINQLRAGQKIQVVQMNLKSQEGKFLGSSETSITLNAAGDEVTIPREDVMRVTLQERPKRLRNALIGAAIGAGAGFALGYAVSAKEAGGEVELLSVALLATAAGAGAGASLPSYPTLYRAPPPAGRRQ